MPIPTKITKYPMVHGVKRVEIPTWSLFTQYVTDTFQDFTNFIYRGHVSSDWLLEPSLDRALKQLGKLHDARARQMHLERFKFSVRGRRGPNPAHLDTENDWWALGQHHGLLTPLLDWTQSPYVAAYFAFANQSDAGNASRAVFALSRFSTQRRSAELAKAQGATAPTLEFIRPLTDENARLVNQGGLFTRAPDGVDVESWVQTNLANAPKVIVYRLEIPHIERTAFLRNLNRMNINHLSLFPDLYGSAKYCNFGLAIDKY